MDNQSTDKGNMTNVSVIEIQNYITDVNYPAGKEDLISTAETNGAPQEVLDILEQLPDDAAYTSEAALSRDIDSMLPNENEDEV